MMPEPPLQPSLPQTSSVLFDVVALVTSAGGLEALSAVLRDLPPPFPAAVIVAQRLSGKGRTLVHILGRRTTLPVPWMQDGVSLAPGQVWVCPPGHRLVLLPDGTCSLSPHEGGARNRSHDFLLESLADSFGKRAMVIVLTGLGSDGAAGYVPKSATRGELEQAIKIVARGDTYLSPAVARHVTAGYRQPQQTGSDQPAGAATAGFLRPHERELLQLIAEGHATKDIASRLYISAKAVESRRVRLMDRLDIHDVPGLVRYAIRAGIVALEK